VEHRTRVTIYYDPDALMVNAPFGANPGASISTWLYRTNLLLHAYGYDVTFVEDHKTPDTWHIAGVSEDDWTEVDSELTEVTEGDWYSYEREERDYEYMGEGR